MISNEQRAHDLATILTSNLLTDSSITKKDEYAANPFKFIADMYVKLYNTLLNELNNKLK